LVPLIEFLLLLLLLLRTALLHGRRGPDERMRRCRGWMVGRLRVLAFLRLQILGLRSSLLLEDSGLSIRHLPDLVVTDVVTAVGLSKWPEAVLIRR
jgi:hypothetical protein